MCYDIMWHDICAVFIFSITNMFTVYASAFPPDLITVLEVGAATNALIALSNEADASVKDEGESGADDVPDSETISFALPIKNSQVVMSDRHAPGYLGVEFLAEKGTSVYASAPGRVIKVDEQFTGYGYHIIIDHENGYQTLYAHNDSVLVSEGDVIKQGDLISTVGRSGNATDYMLYYEIIYDGVPIKTKDIIQPNQHAH